MGNYPKIGEWSKILESSNNRGSITVGEAWPRCPKCKKTWVQSNWVHPWLLVRVTRRLDLEWTWGRAEQTMAACDDEEASELLLLSFDAQKPLDPPLFIPVNTERDRNLLRAAPHDRIRARTGSGVLYPTPYAWQDLEPTQILPSPQDVSSGLNVCHHVHHPGLLLLLLPTCLSCPFSAQQGAGTLLVNKSWMNEQMRAWRRELLCDLRKTLSSLDFSFLLCYMW